MKLLASFLFVTLVSACSTDDGIWYPPDDVGGKADAFTTIKGSDIPSAFVDANKSYLLSRKIASLQAVGAFDMVEDRLAQRIDGIIANMPADGRLHLAELVRMETPAIHDSLFADEKAALPKLWKMVEAPDADVLVTGPDVTFGVLDTATPPGPAVPPSLLAITSLAADLQTPATRLQNKYNADNNATTVMLADLDNAIANPGAFTQAEITAFRTIQAVFREQAVAQATSQISVSPPPGAFAKDATVGPIALHMEGTTRYDEERQYVSNSQLITRLTATQNQTTTVTLPQDAKLVAISKSSAEETTAPTGPLALGAGPYVIEVWKGGQRTFSTNVQAPALARTQMLDLGDKLDYTLVGGLQPLVRNVASAMFSGSSATARFTFDKTAVAPTGTVDASAVQRTASPLVKIAVGRYTLTAANIVLYVYPNNVLWLSRGNQLFRMLPAPNGFSNPVRYVNAQLNATFDTSTNALFVNSQNFTLASSMRDI